MFPILWGLLQSIAFTVFSNAGGVLLSLDFGDFGFWILGILDFGILGILDCGDFGFWILGILDFGILGILDCGDFGFWGFWILGFWGFWILGRSRGCTTRQFGDGAWRSEARIPPGLPFKATSKPTVSNRVGARKQIEHFFQRSEPYKITEKPWLPTKRSELYKITEKPRLPTHFKTNLDEPSDHTPENRRKLKK